MTGMQRLELDLIRQVIETTQIPEIMIIGKTETRKTAITPLVNLT